jgi:hypothetical protein
MIRCAAVVPRHCLVSNDTAGVDLLFTAAWRSLHMGCTSDIRSTAVTSQEQWNASLARPQHMLDVDCRTIRHSTSGSHEIEQKCCSFEKDTRSADGHCSCQTPDALEVAQKPRILRFAKSFCICRHAIVISIVSQLQRVQGVLPLLLCVAAPSSEQLMLLRLDFHGRFDGKYDLSSGVRFLQASKHRQTNYIRHHGRESAVHERSKTRVVMKQDPCCVQSISLVKQEVDKCSLLRSSSRTRRRSTCTR